MAYNKDVVTNSKIKPADGFINVWLPVKGGGRTKIGTFYLRDDENDPKQQMLREWLEENPEKNIEIFRDKIQMDYQPNVPKSEEFDLV